MSTYEVWDSIKIHSLLKYGIITRYLRITTRIVRNQERILHIESQG